MVIESLRRYPFSTFGAQEVKRRGTVTRRKPFLAHTHDCSDGKRTPLATTIIIIIIRRKEALVLLVAPKVYIFMHTVGRSEVILRADARMRITPTRLTNVRKEETRPLSEGKIQIRGT